MIASPSWKVSNQRCLLLAATLLLSPGCTKEEPQVDQPRVTPAVALRDVTFRSPALNRDMQYRVFLPLKLAAGQKLQTVYLLHGGGGGFHDWPTILMFHILRSRGFSW